MHSPGRPERVVLSEPPTRGLLPAVAERVAKSLRGGRGPVVLVDVGSLAHPDLDTVGALLRLQMAARRHGGRIELLHPTERLRELIGLIGVAVELPLHQASPD